ncbi:12951_t:CDS:2 [Rhizophagus irregularis]|uniref:DUF659 domain-containing protein n=1 Tax=Rhizophagus irregularis (strain DAOM 181602 / DAOM 197198 / MUCL 43194) TaxID=747089 RepID=U9U9J1_RHIID|nr:12951_t:CDS:2 [Rhizophagus irregularis]
MARGDVASNDLKQQIKNLQNSIDNNMKEIKKVIDLCGLSTSSTARFYSKINNEYILRRAFFTVIITFLETKLVLEREIELNVAYDPPSRELLANRLFEDELGNVNSKIHKELQMSDNLTLALDGWSSPNHRSIWNFTLLTPNRKEYISTF